MKLEGDGSSIALLDFARGVSSMSSIAQAVRPSSSTRRRLDGDESRLDMLSFRCSMLCLLRLLPRLTDDGGEGACKSQEDMFSGQALVDGAVSRRLSSSSHAAIGISR